jgi:hypothetical protein
MTKLSALVLATALLAGCATVPPPAQQEALVSIGIASAIERTTDPTRTAKLVLEIATMPLSIDGVGPAVKARIGYAQLPASQQLAVDALLDELARQLAAALTVADQDATLNLWRRAAIIAAERFTHRG